MAENNDLLVSATNLRIEGQSSEGWNPIIKGVDLHVNRGEILGLIGESGAGKSTLGLAMMGYTRDGCRISDGEVNFDGVDLRRASRGVRRKLRSSRIAYVAQSAAASFNPAYRLIDQYAEFPVLRKTATKEEAYRDARELYAKIQLPDPDEIGFRYPHQVSGGQLQRAMTAMAMACRPDLIIFDEPTTALDVTTQIEVLGAIRDIVSEFNTAAVYITHDLAVVAQMADRIKVLKDGHEVEEAETRQMLSTPREEYTKSLWAVREFRAQPKPQPEVDAKPLLSVRNVSANYGAVTVLDDISLDVYEGTTVAIVGESGSGKSTTARCITGLLPPKTGSIELDGRVLPNALKNRNREDLRHVQMIYQMADTALNPFQTIRDIVARPVEFYLGLKGKAKRDRVDELLHMIGLEPDKFGHRLPPELSGGQKQRVGIARALAAEPKLIICDEITSALDQLVAEGILRLLDQLQQELKMTYMFITHDLATVKAIADSVIVVKSGKVVEHSDKAALFEPPYHPYTEELLSSVPDMDPDWLTNMLAERRSRR
ncbi:ABC transporter ATP-binding protein [Leisingera sp. S232]|uniref:ABC transporter ATP-binding protein n=1 Tax=Leisingera sp. S232 TaxID=3415132 RepID=UPI0008687A38|nr:ABC transporter [Rhodobacteraceae bacterium (ex Bugula neritina AB1)]